MRGITIITNRLERVGKMSGADHRKHQNQRDSFE